ncbi:MAG: pyrroline-5-carboxylate reductase [Litorimonas sp.]
MSATHLIIGAGKMGGSLLSGWLDTQIISPKSLAVLDPAPGQAAQTAITNGAIHVTELPDIPASITTVLLAIKPQMVQDIGPQIAAYIPKDALMISILAGTSLEQLHQVFGARPIVRAMPNTPAAIGAGITAITASIGQDDVHLSTAETLLSAGGMVYRVENETMINAVTAVSGSGPAYIFHLCEAMEAAALKVGLDETLAPIFARQTIIGAAKLLEDSELSPSELRQNVTSPNGTTQAALDELMNTNGLTPLMIKTVRAAFNRTKALAKT